MFHGSSWLVEFQFCLVSIKNAALNVFLVIFISILANHSATLPAIQAHPGTVSLSFAQVRGQQRCWKISSHQRPVG
jgi:hypothetical protein